MSAVKAEPGGRAVPAARDEHAGQSVSKGQLLSAVWGYEIDPGSNVVGVCVRRLRTKLGDQLITTIRGEGYQLSVG